MDISMEKSVVEKTHIDIITTGNKPQGYRHITGANRVVPLITNVWQNNHVQTADSKLSYIYTCVLEGLDRDCRICDICNIEFLSVTQLEYHVKEIHSQKNVSSKQCFVCRKTYVFTSKLEQHLLSQHGIHRPEMICKICFMDCSTVMERKAHERKHEKTYKCQTCSLKFTSEYFCNIHSSEHVTHIKPYLCKLCGKRFGNMSSLTIHMKRHINSKCTECDADCENDYHLIQHLISHESEVQKRFLNNVDKADEAENDLENILNTYMQKSETSDIGENQSLDFCVSKCLSDIIESVTCVAKHVFNTEHLGIDCYICNDKISTPAQIIEHHKVSHPRNRTCSFCGRRSKSVSMIYTHMMTHLKKNLNIVKSKIKNDMKCRNCSLKKAKHSGYVQKVALNTHVCIKCRKEFQFEKSDNSNFESSGQFVCTFCDHTPNECRESLPQEESSTVDLSHGINSQRAGRRYSKKFMCEVCKKVFLHLTSLIKHKRAVHCMVSKVSKSSLVIGNKKYHLRWQESHEDKRKKKRFCCGYCTVSCRTLSGLCVHLDTHSGEHPYTCEHCNTKFTRQQALKKHLKNFHSEPKSVSYSCTICQLLFLDKGNLLRHHLSVHLEIRRFICGLCGLKYGQNQDLKRHLKQKHEIEGISFSKTDKKTISEIYVYPSIPTTTDSIVIMKIQAAIEEERKKCESIDSVRKNIYNLEAETETQNIPNAKMEWDSSRMNKASQTVSRMNITTKTVSQYVNMSSTLPNTETNQTCINIDLNELVSQEDTKANKESTVNEKNELKLGITLGNTGESLNCSECCTNILDKDNIESYVIVDQRSDCVIPCININLENLHTDSGGVKEDIINHNSEGSIIINTTEVQNSVNSESYLYTKNQVPNTVDNFVHLSQEVQGMPISNIVNGGSVFTSVIRLQQVHTSSVTETSQNGHSSITSLNTAIISECHNIQQYVSQLPEYPLTTEPVQPLSTIVPLTTEMIQTSKQHCNEATNTKYEDKEIRNITESDRFSFEITENLQCEKCGKKYDNSTSLKNHLRRHTWRMYPCSECDKVFKEKGNLKVHMRHHTLEKPYTCTICDKKMRYHKEFVEHKRMHEGILPYECDQCGKQFSRRRVLVRHKQTHSITKRYKCPLCNKMFNRLDQLKGVHMRSHQNDMSNLYTCEECKKNFSVKSKLKQHLTLHTGEKKFSCPHCNKSFALNIYLKSHLKTHEKQNSYIKCPKCPRGFISYETLQVHVEKFHDRGRVKKCDNIKKYYSAREKVLKKNRELQSVVSEQDHNSDDKYNSVLYLEMISDVYRK